SESTPLQPLIEQQEAACRPGQDLQPIAAPGHEHVEVTAVEVVLVLAHDRTQAVDRLPQVDGARGEVDPHRRWQGDHDVTPGAARAPSRSRGPPRLTAEAARRSSTRSRSR